MGFELCTKHFWPINVTSIHRTLYEIWYIYAYINILKKWGEIYGSVVICHEPNNTYFWMMCCTCLSCLSSVIYICYHALKIHTVLQHSIFCNSRFSPTKQSHLLKWLKWKQYFLWIPMLARERLSMLPLHSYFHLIYFNSFFFSCVHMICSPHLWVFCLT